MDDLLSKYLQPKGTTECIFITGHSHSRFTQKYIVIVIVIVI